SKAIKPGGETRPTLKFIQFLKYPHKDFLRQVFRQIVPPRHAVGEPISPRIEAVVEFSKSLRVPGERSFDQFLIGSQILQTRHLVCDLSAQAFANSFSSKFSTWFMICHTIDLDRLGEKLYPNIFRPRMKTS